MDTALAVLALIGAYPVSEEPVEIKRLYVQDRHASLPRYLSWEKDRFTARVRKPLHQNPSVKQDD